MQNWFFFVSTKRSSLIVFLRLTKAIYNLVSPSPLLAPAQTSPRILLCICNYKSYSGKCNFQERWPPFLLRWFVEINVDVCVCVVVPVILGWWGGIYRAVRQGKEGYFNQWCLLIDKEAGYFLSGYDSKVTEVKIWYLVQKARALGLLLPQWIWRWT